MDRTALQHIIDKYLDGKASDKEMVFLERYYEQSGKQGSIETLDRTLMEQHKQLISEELGKEMGTENAALPVAPVHRVHFLKRTWFRYAAAIILIAGAGAYLWNTQQKEKPSVTQTSPIPLQNDVAPGGNKAVLTLADGSHIMLDSAASGQLAREANATITKTGDGRIEYLADEKPTGEILYNTMTTPRGGQYQLTLPDGSRVWLNAESSITYPTAFTGKERRVSVTGEVYFEVTSDRRKPFLVECKNALTIEVLGTHFNINTYNDETTYNTTLLEGSVKLRTAYSNMTLKPGQQGQLNPETEKLSLAVNPDVEQVVAWKNGLFNFNNMKLKEAMKQISKWYDIEVVYEQNPKDITFGGMMGRDLNLSQVLKVLKVAGVQYRIEGKKLIVTN